MVDDNTRAYTEAEFTNVQRAFGWLTAMFTAGPNQPEMVRQAVQHALDEGTDVAGLLRGVALVAYFGYQRAAHLAGTTAEQEIQAEAAQVAQLVEQLRRPPPEQ